MIAKSLWMTGPFQVELRSEVLPEPATGEVSVRTQRSGISTGTELLFYRGEFPQDISLDSSIPGLSGPSQYPLRYGYACVGEVTACGADVNRTWLKRLVFAFHPHASAFNIPVDQVIPVPEGIPEEDAVFFPNLETAVNFVMDGAPVIGESVAVLGQGIVGLLTTALLGMFPLSQLITIDRYPLRRHFSMQVGATASFNPQELEAAMCSIATEGADLVYEVTGVPESLNTAISLAGFDSRIVIGSWYGRKQSVVDLGGKFHRSRIRMISSQVSTLDPAFTGRWHKQRRFEVAWEMLKKIKPSRFATHCFKLEDAAEAYLLLDREPGNYLQVVLTYD